MRTIRDVEEAVQTILAQNSIPINLQAGSWIAQQAGKHPLIALGSCILVMQASIDAMANSAPPHERDLFRAGIQQVVNTCLHYLERTRQMGLQTPEGRA